MDTAPIDNLFRGMHTAPALERADSTDIAGTLMVGHFSRFDAWYEIDSWYEGHFLERTVKGAFRKTMREHGHSVKVQYDHGYDAHVGDALLGPIDVMREDDEGPYFEVPLLDTDYNRDRILPMLSTALMNGETRGTSLLGTSFRFRVTRDEWVMEPAKTDHNPDGIPERTIREVRLYEFGPVVWPANDAADIGVRSLSDHFEQRRLARLGSAERAARHLAGAAPLLPATPRNAPGAEPDATPPHHGTSRNTTDGLDWPARSTRYQRIATLTGVTP